MQQASDFLAESEALEQLIAPLQESDFAHGFRYGPSRRSCATCISGTTWRIWRSRRPMTFRQTQAGGRGHDGG